MIGESRLQSATCSRTSRSPDSAQCRSSTTSSTGRCAASSSRNSRTAHGTSSGTGPSRLNPVSASNRLTMLAASGHRTAPRRTPPRLRPRLLTGQTDGTEHSLAQRPVGGTLAVGKAASGQHQCVRDSHGELLGQPGLPDACGAKDGDELTGAFHGRPPEGVVEQPQLRVAADEHIRGPPVAIPADLATSTGRRAAAGSALPLTVKGSTRSAVTKSRTSRCVLPPSRTSPGGLLLEPRRDVDRIAGRGRAASAMLPDDHLASIDTDADLQRDGEVPLKLLVQRSQRGAQSGSGAHRANASSSRTRGTPNNATTASPMNFSTVPSCSSTAGPHRLEVTPGDVAQRLGVQRLAEHGRPTKSAKTIECSAATPAPPRARHPAGARNQGKNGPPRVALPAHRTATHESNDRRAAAISTQLRLPVQCRTR